jgi:cell division protein FtsZ
MSLNRLDHIPPRRTYAIFIDEEPEEQPVAKIKVVGVGGGGCNAISSMITRGLNGVEFIAINTDVQSLNTCLAPNKLQIGASITKGLGTGGKVELGKKAAEEDREKILKALEGAEMVFITTGEGGGTGTGASPVVGSIARSTGALVVAVVTKPSALEGTQRGKIAEKGIAELREYCDSLIVIPNDNIKHAIDKNVSVFAGYDKPNEVLYNAVKGISDLILRSGKINVDFADVKTVLRDSGDAIMGIGRASGENKVIEALNKAISSPLLEEIDLRHSHSVLVNFTGSDSMTFFEVDEAMKRLQEMLNPNCFIKVGVVHDQDMGDEVMVTIIAAGYNKIPKLQKPVDETPNLTLIDGNDIVSGGQLVGPDGSDITTEIDLDFLPDTTYKPENDSQYEIPTFKRLKPNNPDDNIKKTEKDQEQDKKDKNETDDEFLKEIKKQKRKDDDESDTSAFLRKLMD